MQKITEGQEVILSSLGKEVLSKDNVKLLEAGIDKDVLEGFSADSTQFIVSEVMDRFVELICVQDTSTGIIVYLLALLKQKIQRV